MGILKGAMSAKRYRVVGEAPSGARSIWADALTSHGFQDPIATTGREEVIGWVRSDNLLVSDFRDMDQWLLEPYAHFSFRVDKKALPAQLVRAHVELGAQKWCEEHQRTPCPRSVRTEIRDFVEDDLLRKTLAVPRIYEVSWHLGEGWLLFHGHSERINTMFTRLFFRTFNLELYPDNPLDWLADDELADALESTGATVGQSPDLPTPAAMEEHAHV